MCMLCKKCYLVRIVYTYRASVLGVQYMPVQELNWIVFAIAYRHRTMLNIESLCFVSALARKNMWTTQRTYHNWLPYTRSITLKKTTKKLNLGVHCVDVAKNEMHRTSSSFFYSVIVFFFLVSFSVKKKSTDVNCLWNEPWDEINRGIPVQKAGTIDTQA